MSDFVTVSITITIIIIVIMDCTGIAEKLLALLKSLLGLLKYISSSGIYGNVVSSSIILNEGKEIRLISGDESYTILGTVRI
jgi:hypothetical protein